MSEDSERFDPREFAPWTVKDTYHQIFHVPKEAWRVWTNWAEGFFESAKLIVHGVVEGRLMQGVEGTTGVFLFRHYMELEMKYILFHSRRLTNMETNASQDDIEDVKKTHSLKVLWDAIKKECPKKLGRDAWDSFDTDFVERCVAEFEALDPNGERFRYHGDRFGVDKRPPEERVPALDHLGIDFGALHYAMQHVRDVLNAMDVYLVETHGQNAEWDAILNSF